MNSERNLFELKPGDGLGDFIRFTSVPAGDPPAAAPLRAAASVSDPTPPLSGREKSPAT